MNLQICFCIDSVEFTRGVIDGVVSLGGSESACVGLARGLQARGHDVHIFASKMTQDAQGPDQAGVTWHHTESLPGWSLLKDWDVAVALRQPMFFEHVPAKFRIHWAQDLMAHEQMKNYVMSYAWAYDAMAYVSKFHQKQWEDFVPDLQGLGFVTKNGHDAELAATARRAAVKKPHQIIHISRPERGLEPLLTMWPAVRAALPSATLALCRYSSMYDPSGWGEVCSAFDRVVVDLNKEVGGITYLGELGKPALYQAIAESAVMWYPGISTFGETSCIAAIESQACGTPFVGSYKGALPETVPAGLLIKGVAETDHEYHANAIAAVLQLLDGCKTQSFAYRQMVKAGLAHVSQYTYDVIAEEWEAFLLDQFRTRYETKKEGVLRRLVHEDDFVTAAAMLPELDAHEIVPEADQTARVLSGVEIHAEDYAAHALKPLDELQRNDTRMANVVAQFPGCRNVLDVACGSGAYPISLAKADPGRHVTAVDYSPENIAAGQAAAEAEGVASQITWICADVWTGPSGTASPWLIDFIAAHKGTFDGLWCGEFIEHVVDCTGLVNALESLVTPMGRCVWSCPFGALHNLATRHMPIHRTHVHHFRASDIAAIFGQKNAFRCFALPWLYPDMRGEHVGNWLITYRHDGPTGARPLERRMLLRPYQRLSVGLITNDTLDLRRCLDAVWPIADEIVIGNTGVAAAELAKVVAEFPRKTRVIDVPPVHDLRGGFSEARNRVLQATTGEWLLWIDSDELLCGAGQLAKYLDGAAFRGYVIPQNHLHLDAPMATDTPVRLFRKGDDIQFYGCIHEQPQMHDANGEIVPCLQVADVQIAHTGYLHENIRREKALNRNLPLLVRDQQVFPHRELGTLLVLRDYANLALWDQERAHGALTPLAKQYKSNVVGLFEKYFFDQTHKYHATARPFYEAAIKDVAGAMQIEIGVVGALAPDGLKANHLKPERAWVRTKDHLKTLLHGRVDALMASLDAPKGMQVDPYPVDVPQPEQEAVSA